MRRQFCAPAAPRARLNIEELECRTQPASLDPAAALVPPAAGQAVVIGLPAGNLITTPAASYTPVELVFVTPASSAAGAAAAAPVAAANLVTIGTAPTGTTTTGPAAPSITVIFVDLVATNVGARAAPPPASQMVVVAPAEAGGPAQGADPGETPVVPTNPFLSAGSTTYSGVGQAAIPPLPAVVYRGDYPTLVPTAPAPREVHPGADPAPRDDAAPADVAPPPRSVGQLVPVQGVAGLQFVAPSTETESEAAPAAPAPAAETSSVWGWVGAVAAAVAGGYWVAYRHWRKKSLVARRAVVRFLPDTLVFGGTFAADRERYRF